MLFFLYSLAYQMNAALVSMIHVFQKHYKNIYFTIQTFEQ